MWAIRRASTNYFSFRASGLNIAAFRAFAGLGPVNSHNEEKSSASELHLFTAKRWITSKPCKCSLPVPKLYSAGCRCFSSQIGDKSGGEEDHDLEDGFSELKIPEPSEKVEADLSADDNSFDSESDSELSILDTNVEDPLGTAILGDTEDDASKAATKKKTRSPLVKLVLEEAGSLSGILDKYFEGNDLSRSEVYQVLVNLRRRRLYVKALLMSEWLERKEDFDFSERDYAVRVALIAKVHGLEKAETYIDQIPVSFRQEVVYNTLLANFASKALVQKSEQLFSKMKDLGLPITVFTYNQMLMLYKITDKRKIGDVLVTMEKENLKPSIFTYQVLIETKGQTKDIQGMEQVVETMKAEGVEPSLRIQALLARHYASAGLKEKAEVILKEMEQGNDLKSNPYKLTILLPIYATLGNAKEVERIWENSESQPRQLAFFAAIDSFGKLRNVKQAEAIYEEMLKTCKKISARHYTLMLEVYAENKMLSKGKELLRRMADAGFIIGPRVWGALVKLYVEVGEFEKADSVLQKAVEQNPRFKPRLSTYMSILNQYSRRGDVHNAEKIFQRLRKAGYVGRAKPFDALLQTYINAKVPAYGIRERMKADNFYPNKGVATQLALVDAFKKTNVSELLE